MCLILVLPPKAQIQKEHLVNAVHNNWHSWGLILKDGNGKIMMQKDCPEKGNDPEVIWKLLEDNKDIERILHLRHTTKGGTTMMNAQPFCVYKSDSREVYFMHNGTLHDFGSHKSGEEDKSDTLDFCEKIVSPSLLRWRGENGDADYMDPEYRNLIIVKRWNGMSRGLFVSNFTDNLGIGDWKTYKQEDEKAPVIMISNDDYFLKVIRGPFFEAIQERERQERMARMVENTTNQPEKNTHGHGERDTTFRIKEFSEQDLKKSDQVIQLLDSLYDDEENARLISNISKMDYNEVVHFISTNHNFFVAGLISCLADRLVELVKENDDLKSRNDRLHTAVLRAKIEESKAA